jgi:plastocyanin
MPRLALALLSLCLALPAGVAATGSAPTAVVVRVKDARGAPVADAVVTLEAGGLPVQAPPRTHEVDQRDESFVPYVSVLRPRDSVVFRNSDATRHHVYSFSEAKAFEQLLAPGDVGAPLRVDRAGLVAVGCNIHDHMRAWLVVTDAAHVAVTGADGVARFPAVAPGTWTARAWHPHLHPRQAPAAQSLVLAGEAAREAGFSLKLLPDPRGTDPHRGHY